MNPIEYIEKWISEHGSAAILRDHLALLKSQMSALEVEIDKLKSDLSEIKSRYKNLEAENKDLREKIDEYDKPHQQVFPVYLQPPPSSM